jgi:hypothetical protein
VEYEKMADPRLPACSRKAGQLLETCCSIMDLKGVGLWKAKEVYGYLQRASAIMQNYYPERLGKLYVINAPWGFSSVFSVVKRFLDPVTVSKIHVLGATYQKELLDQVPAENLPAEFGGKCECDGGCQLSDAGPCELHNNTISILCANEDGTGKDQEFYREPAWAKEGEANTIPATESHTGEGQPANADGKAAEAQAQTEGQTAPATQ